ncbi:MAG: cyclic 2,3-diphosphoglycerate synthase [Planctomycetota bacterium]|nr:cyclic 2,3-diphosphoglycerate synthase [Planctomycetota bacterium]MDP6763952.1 cyclic 2,3-diphosphoglycerate synthase [Planctomycetota bacterium]MDP6990963.1 cyclic 2,3-diphosphoglycerate synthase [Planctomycetota bacterium]
MAEPTAILIMGAAGKDFHVFNTCYREREDVRVVAFTATQIPHIDDRSYPACLAGPLYPDGIPIHPEEELLSLIERHGVGEVIFAYSDIDEAYLAERRAAVEGAGAVFRTFDVDATMLASSKPVIAVCAVRTGCGKSQTSRKVISLLRERGMNTIAIRHPMPYGDLSRQVVQRFATLEDLVAHDCTIEEMEEYEPHIRNGAVVYAGVDYAAILAEAEKEADVILWDGGNNDTPFYRPDLWITVADPHRPGHELDYFPGRENFERADVVLINKIDTAPPGGVAQVESNALEHNPDALIVHADSPVSVDDPAAIEGKRVLVVEDGPTLTHGEMKYGAGVVAAEKWGAAEIIDPRPYAVGQIAETFAKYPEVGAVLPAMGYGEEQMRDLQATIEACPCDLVLVGTPIDLSRVIEIDKPHLRVTYDLAERGGALIDAIEHALERAEAAD